MKKIILLLVLALIITSCKVGHDHIKSEIEKANYCEVKEDCVDAGGKCPFGCHILVNKDKVEHISNMINSFPNECIYKCAVLRDFDCIDNKCVAYYN